MQSFPFVKMSARRAFGLSQWPIAAVEVRAIAVAVVASSLLVALSACTTSRQNEPAVVREQTDIHERLSDAISRDGFDHNFLTQREGPENIDVIHVKISLDSLKGRHLSLEKLMTDIGRICSYPSYAHLPFHILIGAGDEDDQMYLYSILATAVKGRKNIALTTATDPRNVIIITVRHSGAGGS